MKKIFFPFVFLLFFSSIILHAQDVKFKALSFDYIQLPLKPLSKSIKNYQSTVLLNYLEDDASTKLTYEERLKKAEDEYAKAMEVYNEKMKVADEKYKSEMHEWNKKTVAEKLLADKEKPIRKNISKPYKQIPIEEKYQKKYKTEELADKYFKLEGFENKPDSALLLTVTLLGFHYVPVELNKKEYEKSGSNQQTIKYFKYSYTIKYKHPVGYRLETEADGLIREDYPEIMAEYSVATSAEYEDKVELEKWWNTEKENYLNNLQEQIVNANLSKIGSLLNNTYGSRKLNFSLELGFVDEKKNYDDMKEAYAAAVSGFNLLMSDKSKARENFEKAVEIWERVIKESDIENKKARIDRDVTKMLMVNLLEVYIWMDDYIKAQAYYDRLMTLDPDKKNKHRAEILNEFMKDAKERWRANK